MQILKLADRLLCYRFPPRPERHFGFNIHVLVDGDRALWIDAGFEDHAAAVYADLLSRGVRTESLVVSHFHADHIFGLRVLPNVRIYGSARYRETFERYPPEPGDHEIFQPGSLLTEDTDLRFGGFRLRFLVMPGHAACNVYTLIDETWLHVGDDIMLSNEGDPLLASVEGDRLSDHIDSLERLRSFDSRTFLPAHGIPIRGAAAIGSAIDERLAYLRTVQAAWPARISVQQATAQCSRAFLHTNWHNDLYP
jgi:glyoxylase-like metal-dependent hydrolase (beta-lactamase superfamily II)